MNFSRQETMMMVLIGVILLLVVVVVGGVAILYTTSQNNSDLPNLLPTASVPTSAAIVELPTELPIVDATNLPPTNTPQPVDVQGGNIPSTSTPNSPTPVEPPTSNTESGVYGNPVPIGTGYRFPGWGIMTVAESRWQVGQTGIAIVKIAFTCERPADQVCDTSDFMFDAIGNTSGRNYGVEFDSSIPEPGFGDIFNDNAEIYGGKTLTGYVGFLIKDYEDALLMRVHIFLDLDTEVFFQL